MVFGSGYSVTHIYTIPHRTTLIKNAEMFLIPLGAAIRLFGLILCGLNGTLRKEECGPYSQETIGRYLFSVVCSIFVLFSLDKKL